MNLSIPVYAGGYRMDADALQAEMATERAIIIAAVLTEAEREAIIDQQIIDQHWTFDEIDAALNVAADQVVGQRRDWRDRHGYTVGEALDRFEALRSQMERDYGIVE